MFSIRPSLFDVLFRRSFLTFCFLCSFQISVHSVFTFFLNYLKRTSIFYVLFSTSFLYLFYLCSVFYVRHSTLCFRHSLTCFVLFSRLSILLTISTLYIDVVTSTPTYGETRWHWVARKLRFWVLKEQYLAFINQPKIPRRNNTNYYPI